LDEGSSYGNDSIEQYDDPTYNAIIHSLNMNGFRGACYIGQLSYNNSTLTVNNAITLPANNTRPTVFIKLTATTTINNNGFSDPNTMYIAYYANGITVPDNIICRVLYLQNSVNLSNKTIIANTVYAETGSTITPGTSTIKMYLYYPDSVNGRTLYNVEPIKVSGSYRFGTPTGVTTPLVFNSFVVPSEGGNQSFVYLRNVTVNKFVFQRPWTSLLDQRIQSSTITKSGVSPVMIQAKNVSTSTFSPVNTFFSVGKDFTNIASVVNLRPSPNPLNFL
jgi:hypothetical protein